MFRWVIAGFFVFGMVSPVVAQMHGAGHAHGAGHGHDGQGHDEVRMPGLDGENATRSESDDLRHLFRNFRTLSREVERLPDGIRTVNRASESSVMEALTRHVVEMIDRVERGDDPRIFIQSPTLDIFFARREALVNVVEVTDDAVIVIQTSDDPAVVAALHRHADEVSDMAVRGMQAVHERMMKSGG